MQKNPTTEPRKSPLTAFTRGNEGFSLSVPFRCLPHPFKASSAEVTTNECLVQHSSCLGEIPGKLGPLS